MSKSDVQTTALTPQLLPPIGSSWHISPAPVPYEAALAAMEARVDDIIAGKAGELVWLLEHPPLYTAGTSADPAELTDANRFPVYATGRGGRYTYHGPGQRVIYVLSDLRVRGQDLRAHIARLENWVIATLASFDVHGEVRDGRVGIWVNQSSAQKNCTPTPLSCRRKSASSDMSQQKQNSIQTEKPDWIPASAGMTSEDKPSLSTEKKIAAIGVRVRKWVAYHGLALNVNPDLSHFNGIVPCGISEHGVTSLHDLGIKTDMKKIDEAFAATYASIFGAQK